MFLKSRSSACITARIEILAFHSEQRNVAAIGAKADWPASVFFWQVKKRQTDVWVLLQFFDFGANGFHSPRGGGEISFLAQIAVQARDVCGGLCRPV